MADITLFAAADYQYFYDHGMAFAKSANRVGHRCLLYIFPDTDKNFAEESKRLLTFLTNEFYTKVDVSMTEVRMLPRQVMQTLEASSKVVDRRALFASIRFMLLYDVLIKENDLTGNSILVLDIDSVINKKIRIAKKYHLGLFLRETENLGQNDYERMGMKVAAGAVYVTMRALPFVEKFSETLIKTQKRWFCDQFILYVLYKENKNNYNILNFDNTFLDWEFKNPKAFVYTGKGARKEDKAYLKLKEELSE